MQNLYAQMFFLGALDKEPEDCHLLLTPDTTPIMS